LKNGHFLPAIEFYNSKVCQSLLLLTPYGLVGKDGCMITFYFTSPYVDCFREVTSALFYSLTLTSWTSTSGAYSSVVLHIHRRRTFTCKLHMAMSGLNVTYKFGHHTIISDNICWLKIDCLLYYIMKLQAIQLSKIVNVMLSHY